MFPPCFSKVGQPVSPLVSRKTVNGALKDRVLSNSMPCSHLKTADTLIHCKLGGPGKFSLGGRNLRLMGPAPGLTQKRHLLGVVLLHFSVKWGRSLRLRDEKGWRQCLEVWRKFPRNHPHKSQNLGTQCLTGRSRKHQASQEKRTWRVVQGFRRRKSKEDA